MLLQDHLLCERDCQIILQENMGVKMIFRGHGIYFTFYSNIPT